MSRKTQQSVQLLLRGINLLLENIDTVNLEFAKHIDWSTFFTYVVENLHAVSHFKHETFSVNQYAMDFGTISKESHKWITKWKVSYFTHYTSYYPVPGLVCHEVPLKIHDLFDSREYSKRGGNCHERMSRTLQTSEAENRSKRDDERQSRRSSTSCIREGKI